MGKKKSVIICKPEKRDDVVFCFVSFFSNFGSGVIRLPGHQRSQIPEAAGSMFPVLDWLEVNQGVGPNNLSTDPLNSEDIQLKKMEERKKERNQGTN